MHHNTTYYETVWLLPFEDDTQKEQDYDWIAEHFAWDCPWLFLYQPQYGCAFNKGWDITVHVVDRAGIAAQPYYAWIGAERDIETIPPPFIPGFSTVIILITSIISMSGIALVVAQKRRKM